MLLENNSFFVRLFVSQTSKRMIQVTETLTACWSNDD